MMPDVLCLRDVSHWYTSEAVVLDRVALTVTPGEIVVVRGGNGSGKTTLLRLAAGIIAPRGGSVSRATPVGYQPQTGEEPPPRMTVTQWLTVTGRMGGIPGPEAALAVLGTLGGDPAVPFASLSRGSVTKVLLAAALARQPRLLLLDEPFAALDPAARAAAATLIREAAAGGAGVLLSDHQGAGDLVATSRVAIREQRLVDEGGPPVAQRWRIVLRVPGSAARELLLTAEQRDSELLAALRRGEEVHRVEEIA
jgi:ABC-type multidrug transport system ATPase subunit